MLIKVTDSPELDELSMKLFNKPFKELRYLMVSHHLHKALIENEMFLRTGLYSWIPAFNGEIKRFLDVEPAEYKNYDIVQVNVSGQDAQLLPELRKILTETKNTHTKLVANNDYTVELWQTSFDYFTTLRNSFQCADMIFGTEPNQVGTLEVLTGRQVYLITHPCFVKRLKTLVPRRKLDVISLVYHRYDNYATIPSLGITGLGYKTRLIGYDHTTDTKRYITETCFNDVMLSVNYMEFIDQLMESKVVVDPFTLTSQSRTGWDCAALGIPFVGSNRNHSVNMCYPRTAISPFNVKEIRDMTKKLLTDDQFRTEIIDYAKEKVEDINYDNSVLKYMRALVVEVGISTVTENSRNNINEVLIK